MISKRKRRRPGLLGSAWVRASVSPNAQRQAQVEQRRGLQKETVKLEKMIAARQDELAQLEERWLELSMQMEGA